MAISPDGQHVAAGSQTGLARVWDGSTGKLLVTFSGPLADVNAVAFSPDGRFLAAASTDQVVRVWKVQDNAVPTITAWPPSATPTKVIVPPTRTHVPPTRTPVPPTAAPVDTPTYTPVPPTFTPVGPTPTFHIIVPILTRPIIIFLPTATPTFHIIIRPPRLTVPIIVLPNGQYTPAP